MTAVGALLDARAVHSGRSVRGDLAGLARSNRLPLRRVDELLETVGLASVADKRAKGLSLGMAQRLGIAAALLGDPQALLLDEPVNGLDPEGVKRIRDLIKRMADEGRVVLVSSHLMSEMALTAGHLVVIGRGRLLADTSVEDFITGNSRSYVLIRTPEPERMRDFLAARGVHVDAGPDGSLEAVGTAPRAVGTLAAENRIAVYEVSPRTAAVTCQKPRRSRTGRRVGAPGVPGVSGVPRAVSGVVEVMVTPPSRRASAVPRRPARRRRG
ncbi:hypothetical protein GCM10027162_55510 [Streptomyces incanus]